MNTPLEDQVHDALHRRADPIQHAPLTVTDVRHRARRIQRRRAAVAGVAVAAVLAIAVPVGLSATGPGQRSDVPPATQTPSPTPRVVSGTIQVDPERAEVVEETPVPLLDIDGPTLITADGTFGLPHMFITLTPYLDGWAGVAPYDEADKTGGYIELLGPDLRVDDEGSPTGGLVARPDGGRIAWSEYDGTRWRVVVADPAGGSEPVSTTFPPSSQFERVEPLGFVSDDTVAVRAMYDTGDPRTFVAGGGQPVEVPGLLQADAASAGVVAGLTDLKPGGACSAVLDAVNGSTMWETCDHRLGPFSATGRYVVGISPETDGNGTPTLTVLDAATGREVLTFEADLPPRTVGGFWTEMTWVGDEALVARMWKGGEESYIVRLGLDGSVEHIGIDSAGASGLGVAVPS